ncbi:hypothetical protein BACCIP111895_02441 [Neobacillus rhizosphaerae]|uniref:Uncharacterized protein n=1 Tax=Neobacillus rhizosphaerae TaxID=2880965 RepID=A0ABN8KS40_9BACI|nr:hypothetical protein BACCIP111895_02441 [Neobacillus rhizosphaerae]
MINFEPNHSKTEPKIDKTEPLKVKTEPNEFFATIKGSETHPEP